MKNPHSAFRLPQSLFSLLRVRLLLLVLLAILPALGLVLYIAFVQRQEAVNTAQIDAMRVVRMAATSQKEHIEAARQLLLTLARLKEMRREQSAECQALFTSLLPLHKVYANIGAMDPAGYVFASGTPTTNPAYLGDRPFFQRVKGSLRFVAGEYEFDRVTGKATLNMAYPVVDPPDGGKLQAVVFAALDLDWLNQFAARSDLLEGSTLTVIDRKGTILLRYPDPGKQLVRQSLAGAPMVRTILEQNKEGTSRGQGLDEVERLFAFTPLSRTGGLADAWVIAGIPARDVVAAAHRLLVQNLIFLGMVAALALGAAWFGGDVFLLQQVHRLIHATQRLRAGELHARTGIAHTPGELGQLAGAFDDMAESLEQRVAERERAQAELKKLNEELEQRVAARTLELRRSNEELEQFAYVASHDLQEPLRMVTNYMQLLRQRYADRLDTGAQDFIGFALDGAVRMQRLITDLLTYSRVGTQGRPLEPANSEEVLTRVLTNLKVAIDESGAGVTHDPLPTVLGDTGQLTQLLQNLIGNAIKFRGEKPPRVHISAQRVSAPSSEGVAGGSPQSAIRNPQSSWWEFSIRDNGIGISPQEFERIFVIFQRLHGREKYPGTGIGLSICKKIVERHGGRIWLESQPDQGTTFHFTLPAAD